MSRPTSVVVRVNHVFFNESPALRNRPTKVVTRYVFQHGRNFKSVDITLNICIDRNNRLCTQWIEDYHIGIARCITRVKHDGEDVSTEPMQLIEIKTSDFHFITPSRRFGGEHSGRV